MASSNLTRDWDGTDKTATKPIFSSSGERTEFDNMSIGVIDERLCSPIRSGLGRGDDGNPLFYGFRVCLFSIVHLKSKMVGPRILLGVGITCPTRLIEFKDQVDLLISNLKPVSVECKRGPGNMIHA